MTVKQDFQTKGLVRPLRGSPRTRLQMGLMIPWARQGVGGGVTCTPHHWCKDRVAPRVPEVGVGGPPVVSPQGITLSSKESGGGGTSSLVVEASPPRLHLTKNSPVVFPGTTRRGL